ncbi:MAG: EAL domain-containing protein [Pseudomonadota bacterium]
MGSSEDVRTFDVEFVVNDALASAVYEIAQTASDACEALAAAIRLPGALRSVATGSNQTSIDDDLVGRLADYLDTCFDMDSAPQTAGVAPDIDGDSVVFMCFPLTLPDQGDGAMAVAIPRERWKAGGVFERCTNVVALVAMLIANSKSRYQLEADMSDMRSRANHLTRVSEIDELTGLENKASFEKKVKLRLTQTSRPAALLAIDLDHFKQVNDHYGHQFGDQFLQTVGAALRASLPPSAIIGRTGGDEFCVLIDLPDAGRGYLQSTIRRARAAVQRNIAVYGKSDLARMSIGVSLFPMQATQFDMLFRQADLALYGTKGTERNTTSVYDTSLDGVIDSTDTRSGDMPRIADRVTVQFQPIIDLNTDARQGLEVLARWRTDDGQVIGPKAFAWLFKDHRYASRLTMHIVETALRQLGDVIAQPGEMPALWINVTDQDLLSPEFVFDLQAVLSSHGVSWSDIVIEVSETSMLGERSGQVFHSLQEMRRRGGRIALDDFGTGYAGLAHVSHWPVDIIKIDRSFIKMTDDGRQGQVVVKALLMIADAMGQDVVAEGVETPLQLEAVRALGCSFAQGFLLGHPVDSTVLDHASDACDVP